MFFYLNNVILFFPKHNNYMVFWCNSRRNHANHANSRACSHDPPHEYYQSMLRRIQDQMNLVTELQIPH